MASRFVKALVTIFVLQTLTPPSYPIRQCASNSFFNRSTGLCQECTRYCPAGTVMTRDCQMEADVVCSRLPSACASGWYLDRRKGRCRECTRFCTVPLDVVTPCTNDTDMVCGTRTRPTKRGRPGPKAPKTTPTVPFPTPLVTTHRPSEEINPATTSRPGQRVPTTSIKLQPNVTEEAPQNVATESASTTDHAHKTVFSEDLDVSTDVPALQSDRSLPEPKRISPSGGGGVLSTQQQTDDTKFYLWIAVSVLVSVVVVVVASLAVYCTGLKCRDCAGEKAQKMGEAGSGGMQRAVDNTQDEGGLPIDLQLPGPTSLQPPPQFRGSIGGPNPTASLAIEDECAEVESCACATSIPPSIGHARWSYEEGSYHGRSSSLSNMYPPASRPLVAPSRVMLRSDGTTETQLTHCACVGDVYSGHHCCHGRHGPVGIAFHPLPSNCSMSTFSVVSGGSEYTV
ncbi:uncharacterized protein LOC119725748 [Patiria miniata]|uniref:TNFR-Cys domain-containing protein n=1 Tax=Patiria miniata TaxID=46514 RepID=A0A913ZQ96_PATMI|nr:uncharacterized protein LOC119725748 [Patiria miniata]